MEAPPSFHEAFSPGLKERLVELLNVTTEAAASNHAAASDFSTANSFGNDCWQFREQALVAAAQEESALFRARFNQRGALRCHAGEWEFGVYCVGRSASADIRSSFPNPQNSAGDVGTGAYLPADGMAPQNDDRARGAIVAYMASPDAGLGAVYLCIPRVDPNGNILEWLYTELVWRRENDPVSGPTSSAEAVPAEREERPQVRRRARGERRAG